MKGFLLLGTVALAAYLAVALAMRLGTAGEVTRRVRRGTWLVASTLLLVLVVLAAREMGLFTVPLVAATFLCGALAAPWLIALARRQSSRTPTPAARPAHPILARHHLAVMTFLVLTVAVAAVVVGMVVAPR